jgi:hypothetical protein
LLLRNGVNQEDAARVNRFARGHPLALKLAAAAIAERPNLRLEDLASRHIVAELTNLYLADVRDPLTREALDAASVVRRTTLSLLGAMLPDVNALDAYERLSALPFTEHGRDGLILADTVQQAIAAALRAADPSRYRALRRAAWRQLRQESRMAGSQDLWRYTADMLYLIEQPVIREAFFPSQSYPLTVETAWLEDGPAIHAISHRHEGPTAASLLDYWWQQLPNSFRTVRDHRGVTIGYYCMFVPTTVEPAILRHDPLIWKWWQHLQSAPVPEKQTVLFARRWLAQDEGESPSAVQAACWLDIKASYMSLRAVLRRIYCTARHTEVYAPILQQLGFQLLPQAQVELDNTLYHTAMLDFGPDLFLGWLSGHIDTELGSDPDQLLDVAGRALRIDGNQVPLTPLEFKVMRYLMDREGQAVTRIALLADVWGYEYQGGSNIVDAVIRTLRKKLAEHASRIETVSGVGYRFRGQ